MTITQEMTIPEIVEKYPATEKVFNDFDIRLEGYKAIEFETVFATARVHQLDLDKLLSELNKAAK